MFHAIYAQDQWTVKRLTLQGALRFDRAFSWHPAGQSSIGLGPSFVSKLEGPAATGPVWLAQPFVVNERRDSVTGYKDISPPTAVNTNFNPTATPNTWLAPTAVLSPRFTRFQFTFDF